MLISVTTLCSYLYCRRKLYLELVCGIKEPSKPSTVIGSLKHLSMERFHKLEQDMVSQLLLGMSREDVNAIYIDASVGILRGIVTDSAEKLAEMKIKPEEAGTVVWPYLEMMIRERSHIAFSTMCSTRLSGKELWEVLTPKIIAEKYISSEDLRLKGIIDRIEVHGNEHIPYEIKSGSSPRTGAWPGHRIQMAAYLLLLSEHLNRKVGLGYISYMESGRNVPVVMNPFLRDEVLLLRENVMELVNSGEIPGFPDSMKKCSCCGLREKCHSIHSIGDIKNEVQQVQ